MSKVQTDNSYFDVKVKLRVDNLPRGKCQVLDCFAGDGNIWEEIKHKNPQRHIEVLRIDAKKSKAGVYLKGDNRKFLPTLDLNQFNVIDLDAYGVPYHQLKLLFSTQLTKPIVVFVTFIQSMYGQLPTIFLGELGFSKTMVKKCPSLFNQNGFEKLKQYLALNGIRKIKHYNDHTNRKHYLCFTLGKKVKR